MLEVQGIHKKILGRVVIDNVSFTVPQGTVFGFLGQNGAGKTTTIKMLVGLNQPNAGSILIDKVAPTHRSVRERIGFMPETPHYYGHLTGLEFLCFCSHLFRYPKTKQACGELLERVGIYEARDLTIADYSKGMKQRLGFAQAIVNDPDYIFLDEPLDGLDPIGRLELKKIILDLKAQGKTVFFNSHILFDMEEICDQIGILHRGSLVYAGAVDAFTHGRSLEEQFVDTITAITKTA